MEPWESPPANDDIGTIMRALFDIRGQVADLAVDVAAIRGLLEEDEEEEDDGGD